MTLSLAHSNLNFPGQILIAPAPFCVTQVQKWENRTRLTAPHNYRYGCLVAQVCLKTSLYYHLIT